MKSDKKHNSSEVKKILESNEHLSLIFDNIDDVIFLSKFETPDKFIIVETNQAYIKMCQASGLEISAKDLIGRDAFDHIKDFLKSEDKQIDKTKKMYKKVIKTQVTLKYEAVVGIDGENFHSISTLIPIKSSQNKEQYIMHISHDYTTEKNAFLALEKSEEKYRQITENTTDIISSFDLEGRHISVNKQVCEALNMTKDQILGKTPIELGLSKESSQEYLKKIKKIINTKDKFEDDFNRKMPNGSTIYFWNVLFPIIDKDNNVIEILATTRDISAQKKAEIELKTNRDYLKKLMDSMWDAVFSLKYPENEIEWVNDSYNITGYDNEEFIGNNLEFLFPSKDDSAVFNQELQNQIESGKEVISKDVQLMKKNGNIFPAEMVITVFKKRKKLENITCIIRDVSKRIQILNELKNRNRYIETIMNNMPIGLAVNTIDDGDIKYINKTFEEIYGWSRSIITNVSSFFEKVFPDTENRKIMQQKIISDMQSGDPEKMNWDNLKITQSSGEEKYVHAINIPLLEQNLMISTVQDVTERKLAEDSTLQSLREKETLLRELYHRTKNNMNVIQSILSLNAMSSNNPEVTQIVEEMKSKIQTMSLVHQMLYQSKDLSRINLHDYVPQLTNILMQSYANIQQRVNLKMDIEKIFVTIDTAIPCGLVLNELLSNIFKYAFPGENKGMINIKLTKNENDKIKIKISDDGIGVPDNFDFFNQKTLGLKTIVMIVKHQLHGEISFVSQKGLSCEFIFRDLN